jgi:hypothetical protein
MSTMKVYCIIHEFQNVIEESYHFSLVLKTCSLRGLEPRCMPLGKNCLYLKSHQINITVMNPIIENVIKRIWRSANYTDAIVEHYINHVASQTGASPADVRKEIDDLAQKHADQNKMPR